MKKVYSKKDLYNVIQANREIEKLYQKMLKETMHHKRREIIKYKIRKLRDKTITLIELYLNRKI